MQLKPFIRAWFTLPHSVHSSLASIYSSFAAVKLWRYCIWVLLGVQISHDCSVGERTYLMTPFLKPGVLFPAMAEYFKGVSLAASHSGSIGEISSIFPQWHHTLYGHQGAKSTSNHGHINAEKKCAQLLLVHQGIPLYGRMSTHQSAQIGDQDERGNLCHASRIPECPAQWTAHYPA